MTWARGGHLAGEKRPESVPCPRGSRVLGHVRCWAHGAAGWAWGGGVGRGARALEAGVPSQPPEVVAGGGRVPSPHPCPPPAPGGRVCR